MGNHLTEVADFLRKAPMIKFALTPVTTPRDLESLQTSSTEDLTEGRIEFQIEP